MGYSTYFEGVIKITPEPTAKIISFIQAMVDDGEANAGHMDFEWTKDFTGLQHNGDEKSYRQEEVMQEVIDIVVEEFPDVKFNGVLKAKGEDYDDRWLLKVVDNVVEREEQVLTGTRVTCPHCEEEFILNEE